MTTTNHTEHAPRSRATGGATPIGPIGIAASGVMIVVAAFVALIVAAVAAADLFSPSGGDAADRGVWMATQAWATPLALVGLAVLFAGAVPVALRNIRSSISFRRDSMVSGLPAIVAGTTAGMHRHVNTMTTTNTINKENVR